MEDFTRDFVRKHFADLTPEERAAAVRSLPPEEQENLFRSLPLDKRMAGLSPEQIRQYLERLPRPRAATPRKPHRKK